MRAWDDSNQQACRVERKLIKIDCGLNRVYDMLPTLDEREELFARLLLCPEAPQHAGRRGDCSGFLDATHCHTQMSGLICQH